MMTRCLPVAVALLLTMPALAKGPKLTPEELVAHHLEALGPAEARAMVKNRFCQGQVRFRVVQGGAGGLTGAAGLVSEGSKLLLGMKFGHPDYAGERASFDGEEAFIGTIKSGRRSELGSFLYQHPVIQQEGLLGGTLSTAWSLLELKDRNPRLKYKGLKKVRDQKLLLLTYRPRKGADDLEIKIYFDPESYRHVYTSYELLLPAPMGAVPELSSRQQEDRWFLEERFDDFRELDGLQLPQAWSLTLSIHAQNGSTMTEWVMVLPDTFHNEAVDPALFEAPKPQRPGKPAPAPAAKPDSRPDETQNFRLNP